MKHLCRFLSLLLLSSVCSFADETVFVSATGDDANSGLTEQQAVKTLAKGLEIVRAKNMKTMQITGRHFITEPLVLTPKESGLTLLGTDGEKSVIDGGKVITGWKPYKDGIWQAPVEPNWSFRQIYVNGKHRYRARTPNTGFFRAANVPYDASPWKSTDTLEYNPGEFDPNGKDLSNAAVVVYHFWNDVHLPIASVDGEKHLVKFQTPSGKALRDNWTDQGARYFIENSLELLDAPGEWFCDTKNGILYYQPFPDEDMTKATVAAPFATELLRIEGNPVNGEFVEQVSIKTLQFEHCNFVFPKGETNGSQASLAVSAAITFKGAKRCSLDECNFYDLGTYGVDFQAGCQDNTVKCSHFRNLSAGGIKMNGGAVGTSPLLHTKNNKVSYCSVKNYGIDYPSAVGFLLRNISDSEFCYNEICNGNYSGVSLGWSWGYGPSIARNNLIHHNHIHHLGLELRLSDMGGIYTLGQASGSILSNNVIHDITAHGYGGWGIYSDEGTTGLLIEKNIVYNTEFAGYDMHYGRDVLIRNNIFAFGNQEQINRTAGENHISLEFTNNIVYWKTGELFNDDWKDREYQFHLGRDREITRKTNFQSDWNCFYNPAKKLEDITIGGKPFADWQQRGYDKNSVYADPLFENVDKYDFRLKQESPALQRGFEPISTEGIPGL